MTTEELGGGNMLPPMMTYSQSRNFSPLPAKRLGARPPFDAPILKRAIMDSVVKLHPIATPAAKDGERNALAILHNDSGTNGFIEDFLAHERVTIGLHSSCAVIFKKFRLAHNLHSGKVRCL